MPAELMTGQPPVMPTETVIVTWAVLPWKEEMTREELLAIRIRRLEGRSEDIAEAIRRQQEARLRNKSRFDAKHRLRPRKIEEGDWVIVYDSSLDHQHTTLWKFAKRWFGPYEVRKVFDNGTYRLCELDGTVLRVPIVGKRVKIFKKQTDKEPYMIQGNTDIEEQSDEDHDNAGSEESELRLIVDIREESRSATDEDGYDA
jgi:hypothetical protein